MRIASFSLILYFTAIILSCSTSTSSRTQTRTSTPAFLYYQRALSDIEYGDLKKALAEMDTAISIKREFAQFHYVRGQILELLGRSSEAIIAYENSLNYKSHFPDAWKSLAHLYMQSARYQKAVRVLRDLTTDQPDSIRFEVLLADAYLKSDKPLLALERVNYFQKQGGTSIETERIKGLAYYVQRDYQKAERYLETYLRKKPENFEAQKYLGMAFIKTSSLDKGISHLNKALKINPDDPEIYLYRARYFIQRKKLSMAAEQLNVALNLDSKNSKVLLEIGKFFLMQKDTVHAEQSLQRAIDFNPECWECFKILGIIADEQGKHFEALYFLQKYLSNIYTRDPEAEQRLDKLRQINY